MSWLSKLFGQCGTIRFEGTLEDGKKFDGKIEIESFNVSTEQAANEIEKLLFVKYGWRARDLSIVAFAENIRST